MAQAESAQIQQDLLACDQESLYREVMQHSYNTIFRASPLQLPKSELLAHLRREHEDRGQNLQSSSHRTDQRIVKEVLKKWPETRTCWNSYRSPVSVPSSDSSSSDDEITSEKEEEENIHWEGQKIAKLRAALLGTWKKSPQQEKACKVQHSCLQECHASINCADVKKNTLPVQHHSQQGTDAKESQHICLVCGKNFCRRASLNRHLKIHSGDKPFKCSTCGKCFLAKTSLALHKERLHKRRSCSGTKPWQCRECGQNFATRDFLTEHQRLHTSKKTFPCPVCEKHYREVRCLVGHLMATHAGEHVFKCSACGKGFMKEKQLTKHHMTFHGNNSHFLRQDDDRSGKEKSPPIKHKRLHLNHKTPARERPSPTICKGSNTKEYAHTCCHCGKLYKQEKSFINHQNACMREQQRHEGGVLKGDAVLTKKQSIQIDVKGGSCFDCGEPLCKNSAPAPQPQTEQEKNLHVSPEGGKIFGGSQCFVDHLKKHKNNLSQKVSSWEGLEKKQLSSPQQEKQLKESTHQCPTCRRIYSTYYNLRRHQQVHLECRSRRKAHKGKDATYSWSFQDIQNVHGKGTGHQHKCPFCGKVCRTKSVLSRHQQIHIKGKPYKCNICGKAFAYKYTLAYHQEVHLEDQLYQYKCSLCEKAFRTQSALARHQQLHMEGKPFICNVCGKAFAYRYSLTNHREIHVEGRVHKCSFCRKAFRTSYSLNRHRRIHMETRSYQCPTCRKAFGTKYSLLRHQEMHVEENSDNLFISKKETDDRSTQVKEDAANASENDKQIGNPAHPKCQGDHREATRCIGIADHQKPPRKENAIKQLDNPFKNVVSAVTEDQARCTKGQLQKWPDSSVYYGHQGVLVKEDPPESSMNKEAHTAHLEDNSVKELNNKHFLGQSPSLSQKGMITKKEKSVCLECGKSFRNQYSLTRHQKSHISERPHQCPRCEKSFRHSKDLEKHQVTHSDLRPHQCSECGKGFKRKSTLTKHKKIHKGEKPYCCPSCGKRVTTKAILQNHIRIHTGERPYKCIVCDKGYMTKWSLKKHLELHFKTDLLQGPCEGGQLDQGC